jgi:RNA 3'-terminal phosphate cyclase (ATP)
MSTSLIELDGSFGEGGGQILRTSLTLSLLTGKPFHLANVRARRPKPGLQPQHLMCVQAAAAIGQATVRGASRDSSDLVFEPRAVVPGKYHFAIGTAGATGLVLHTLYLPLALCCGEPSEVVISGGTHVKAAPSFDFLESTWRGYLEALGLRIKLQMVRPGFYPRGGGTVRAHIQPWKAPRGLNLEIQPATRLRGFSVVAGLPEHIAQRQAHRAAQRLKNAARHLRVNITEDTWHGGPGTVLALELNTVPAPTLFFALGERGKKAERVADEAVEQVLDYLAVESSTVDIHSADQLVLPLALAEGASSYPVAAVTLHLMTNAAVIQKFVDRRITIEGEEGQPGRVNIG